MKKLITLTLTLVSLNSFALVKLSDNTGKQADFKTVADITSDKVVCIYTNRKYLPITKKAVELSQGKTCRTIGRVGVDYIGINSTTRNAHLYNEVLEQVKAN